MRPHILATIGALLFLGIGLYLLLPRKNEEAGPLQEQVEITGTVGGVSTIEEESTLVSESMVTTARQFFDEVVQLDEGSDSTELEEAFRYLGPSFQEAFQEDGLTRDDFVVLFDKETRAFPPTGYEILDSDVINENLEEVNVRMSYEAEEDIVYNVELERMGNEWKVVAVN